MKEDANNIINKVQLVLTGNISNYLKERQMSLILTLVFFCLLQLKVRIIK